MFVLNCFVVETARGLGLEGNAGRRGGGVLLDIDMIGGMGKGQARNFFLAEFF